MTVSNKFKAIAFKVIVFILSIGIPSLVVAVLILSSRDSIVLKDGIVSYDKDTGYSVNTAWWIEKSNDNPPKYRWCNKEVFPVTSCSSNEYDSYSEAYHGWRKFEEMLERGKHVRWQKVGTKTMRLAFVWV